MYKTTDTRGGSVIVKQIKTNYIFLISSVSGRSTQGIKPQAHTNQSHSVTVQDTRRSTTRH